jgi:hypothetical protein
VSKKSFKIGAKRMLRLLLEAVGLVGLTFFLILAILHWLR